jgi:hypothetical protein
VRVARVLSDYDILSNTLRYCKLCATDPDGTTVVVVGEGLKAGEQMECVDRGNMIACQAL